MKRGNLLFAFFGTVLAFQYGAYLVDSIFWDRLIKIGAILGLVLLVRQTKVTRSAATVLGCYAGLLLSALLGAVIAGDPAGFSQLAKVFLPFLILPLFLLTVGPGKRPTEEFLGFPVGLGAVLSAQSLILFVLVYFNWIGEPYYTYFERYHWMAEKSFGPLGYANAMQSVIQGDRMLRSQSWFLEPSTFAGFLFLPLFGSYGLWRLKRSWPAGVAALLCLGALLSTFSLAGIFGLLAAVAAGVLFRTGRPGLRVLMFAGTAFFAMQLVLSFTYSMYKNDGADRTIIEKVIGRDPAVQKILRASSNAGLVLSEVAKHPLGLGLGNTSESSDLNSPNAILLWTFAGGIPAFVIVLVLYFLLGTRYCLPLLSQGDPLGRGVALAFVGSTIQGLSYGRWLEPHYLMTVGLMVAYGDSLRLSRSPTAHR